MNVRAILVMALLGAILASPAAVAAHEDAVLRSPRSSVPAGDVLAVRGSDFEPGGRYTLRLAGPLREYPILEVEADSTGEFSLDAPIGQEVAPGAYKIEAVALDGDVVASMDLTVLTAASTARASGAVGQDMPLPGEGMAPMARADDIRIERDRNAIEWGVIGLIIGAAAGLGSGLLIAGRAGPGLQA